MCHHRCKFATGASGVAWAGVLTPHAPIHRLIVVAKLVFTATTDSFVVWTISDSHVHGTPHRIRTRTADVRTVVCCPLHQRGNKFYRWYRPKELNLAVLMYQISLLSRTVGRPKYRCHQSIDSTDRAYIQPVQPHTHQHIR
jgi:hypothetical protein